MWLRYSGLILLLGLAACQSDEVTKPSYYGKTQLRAMLTKQQGEWLATDCVSGNKEHFSLIDEVSFMADANQLLAASKEGTLFIDAEGFIDNKPTVTTKGSFTVKKLNRLTLDTNKGCSEADYNRVIVRSVGKNPLWFTSIAPKGLVLERVNQQPIIAPYVVERLPGGQMNFSTDANGQHVELWVAPERCEDEETGEVYSMLARLNVNMQTFRGCAYLGQAGMTP